MFVALNITDDYASSYKLLHYKENMEDDGCLAEVTCQFLTINTVHQKAEHKQKQYRHLLPSSSIPHRETEAYRSSQHP
jgi:hypothetical protein